MSIHLIQHPENPLFLSYQCPMCETWNCFNFATHFLVFNMTKIKTKRYCIKCNSYNDFNIYAAGDIILRKHSIVLDRKSINYDTDLVDKLKELLKFYKMLGSSDEKPNIKKFSFNPFDNMFED